MLTKDGTGKLFRFGLILFGFGLMISACTFASKTSEPQSNIVPTATITPDWFNIEMTDVQTGKTFSMNDYAGKCFARNHGNAESLQHTYPRYRQYPMFRE